MVRKCSTIFLNVLDKTIARCPMGRNFFYEDKVVEERYIKLQKEERKKRMERKDQIDLDEESSIHSDSS